MQRNSRNIKRAEGGGPGAFQEGRRAPEGMPRQVPGGGQGHRLPEQKPRDVLPQQKPVTDEENTPKPTPRWQVVLKRVGLGFLLLTALVMAYLFLLLGEPDNAAQDVPKPVEEAIRVPMAAMEAQADADMGTVSATFGKPLLMLYGNALPLQKMTLYDTAFGGGYARRATLSYAFPDGQILLADRIRPTAAAALLGSAGKSLSMAGIYGLAGFDAARMDDGETICVFAQSEEAVYAITCPSAHAQDLAGILKQTTLWQSEAAAN